MLVSVCLPAALWAFVSTTPLQSQETPPVEVPVATQDDPTDAAKEESPAPAFEPGEPWPVIVVDDVGNRLPNAEVMYVAEGDIDPFILGPFGVADMDRYTAIEWAGEVTYTDEKGTAMLPDWDTSRGRLLVMMRYGEFSNLREFKAPKPEGIDVRLRKRGSVRVRLVDFRGEPVVDGAVSLRVWRDGEVFDLTASPVRAGTGIATFDVLERFEAEVEKAERISLVQRGAFASTPSTRLRFGEWPSEPLVIEGRQVAALDVTIVNPNGQPVLGELEVAVEPLENKGLAAPVTWQRTDASRLILQGVEPELPVRLMVRRPGGANGADLEVTAPAAGAAALQVEAEYSEREVVLLGRFLREDGRVIERQPILCTYRVGNALMGQVGEKILTPGRGGRFQLGVPAMGSGDVRNCDVTMSRPAGNAFPELKATWSLSEAQPPGVIDLGDVVLVEQAE